MTAAATAYRALDWSFAVEADDPAVAAQVRRALVDLEHPGPAEHRYRLLSPRPDRTGTLHVDDEELAASANEPLLYRTLLWHVNRGVADTGGRCVLLHASCVADDAGRAAVMAAPMESGKTTLAAGLVRSGLAYLTDETVALDPVTHRITAYPKPLSVDDGSWEVLADLRPDLPPEAAHLCAEQWQVPASAVGRVADAADPAVLLLPRYEAGSPLRLEPLAPAAALVELLHSTFAPERAPERDFRSLAALCRDRPSYRLVSGDLGEAVTAVRGLLAGSGAAVSPAAARAPRR